MIRKVTIENFKSIDRLELDLGRVNVFIGENGCGKSNILEAISFGAAAAADKLDHEFLVSRGIRVTDPKLMRSAFKAESRARPIVLSFHAEDSPFTFTIEHEGGSFSRWHRQEMRLDKNALPLLKSAGAVLLGDLISFLAYVPQLDALRTLDLDVKIEPISIHGEGLFKLLQVLEQEGHLPEVKAELEMIDWFADLEVFSGPNPALRELRIRDQYLDSAVAHFDQRSANEGFLFLLLYTCLLVSEYTPTFFAVDNIETGLNPKLCAGLIAMFARLTKSHDKQVLLTTHNPGTLDGLDLNDDEQRLFVVYRNVEGATRVRRVERGDLPAGEQPVRLSEAFLRGYIGGLPTNF